MARASGTSRTTFRSSPKELYTFKRSSASAWICADASPSSIMAAGDSVAISSAASSTASNFFNFFMVIASLANRFQSFFAACSYYFHLYREIITSAGYRHGYILHHFQKKIFLKRRFLEIKCFIHIF